MFTLLFTFLIIPIKQSFINLCPIFSATKRSVRTNSGRTRRSWTCPRGCRRTSEKSRTDDRFHKFSQRLSWRRRCWNTRRFQYRCVHRRCYPFFVAVATANVSNDVASTAIGPTNQYSWTSSYMRIEWGAKATFNDFKNWQQKTI